MLVFPQRTRVLGTLALSGIHWSCFENCLPSVFAHVLTGIQFFSSLYLLPDPVNSFLLLKALLSESAVCSHVSGCFARTCAWAPSVCAWCLGGGGVGGALSP